MAGDPRSVHCAPPGILALACACLQLWANGDASQERRNAQVAICRGLVCQADLLPRGAAWDGVASWLTATAVHKRLNPIATHLVSSRTGTPFTSPSSMTHPRLTMTMSRLAA